jgi:phosphopantothenoylcysteine decarboxylase/phosphopantothenate--cysteine ligase
MAAAVADFRPAAPTSTKIKKTGGNAPVIKLEQTTDILAAVARDRVRAGQVVVGFGAETGDAMGTVLDYGRRKLEAKGCDLLVVNEVGENVGFERDDNEAVILGADGSATPVPRGPKAALANVVWDLVADRLRNDHVNAS